jgi:hypothetical protein
MAFVSGDPSRFWCESDVPFEVADDIFLDDDAKEIVREAVDLWNSLTTLRLFSRFDDENQPDYIVFTKHPTSCSSPVGRQGGAQLVGCPIGGAGGFTAGSVMHEIGHAVGFHHEHCRPDRNQRITINWDNIEPEEIEQFCPKPPKGQLIGDYDYSSIMHYGRKAFSANGIDTIEPTDPSAVIGQSDKPSPADIEAIKGLCPTVPLVRELPPSRAAQKLRDVGLVPSFTGDPSGTWVWRQSPWPGTVVGRGTVVTLQLRAGEIPLIPPPTFNILGEKTY